MPDLFLRFFNMSISAGWLALAVIAVRFLFRKAPKRLFPVLWILVGVRLVLPFTVESALSLIPSAETVAHEMLYSPSPVLTSGVPLVDSALSPVMAESLAPTAGDSVNPMQILLGAASILWIAGAVGMLAYAVVSTLLLRRRMAEAVRLEGDIWLTDRASTPFVLGVVMPRIYIPYSLPEQDLPFVLAHERAHIARRDHWIKPAAFLLLSVYWFHPLLWVAYILLCRDVEMACDERVVRDYTPVQRADYSEALLSCSVPRHRLAACPLAFGEVGVKARVKSVLRYKKPAFWVILLSAAAVTVLAVCFLTNPAEAAVKNPAVREYEPGAEGIVGNVNTADFTRVAPEFAVGADRYGVAVFKNPRRAWEVFLRLYRDTLETLEERNDLKPISLKNRSEYKMIAAQAESEDPIEQERFRFVARFLDIYENSFEDHGGAENVPPTAETAVPEAAEPLPDEVKIDHAAVTRTVTTPHRAFEGEFSDRLRLRVWYAAESLGNVTDLSKVRAEIWSVEEVLVLEPEEGCRAEGYRVKFRYRTKAGDWTDAPDLFFMAFTMPNPETGRIEDCYDGGPFWRNIGDRAGAGYLADYSSPEEALLMREYDENRYRLAASRAVSISGILQLEYPASITNAGNSAKHIIETHVTAAVVDLYYEYNLVAQLLEEGCSPVILSVEETVPLTNREDVSGAGYEITYRADYPERIRSGLDAASRESGQRTAEQSIFIAAARKGDTSWSSMSEPADQIREKVLQLGWNGDGDPRVWLVENVAESLILRLASGQDELPQPATVGYITGYDPVPISFPREVCDLPESALTAISEYIRFFMPAANYSGVAKEEDSFWMTTASACEARPTLLYTEEVKPIREYGGVMRHFTLECYSLDLKLTIRNPGSDFDSYGLRMEEDGFAVPQDPIAIFLAAEETEEGTARFYVGDVTKGGSISFFNSYVGVRKIEENTRLELMWAAMQSWRMNAAKVLP